MKAFQAVELRRYPELRERIDGLAIFGGQPTFDRLLHVGEPNLGDEEAFFQRVRDLLQRRWFTNDGPYVQEFERRVREVVGTKHCVAVTNGTTGLEILLKALDISGEVIVPSFTFIASAHVLSWLGIKPIFCDIDPDTHNIDPNSLDELITDSTTAIMGVHVWGRPCEIDQLNEIARRRSVKLIFDAAHAFGASFHGTCLGNFGEAEVFSFHATKHVNSLEGGVIATNNDELAERCRLMRNFGFSGYDNVVDLGINGKMNEISAAMGISTLEVRSEILDHNLSIYKAYLSKLEGVEGLSIVQYDSFNDPNYHYIVIEIDEAVTGVSRDDLYKILHAENVLARRYFYPGCHRMEPYASNPMYAEESLPHTEFISERVLVLPTGTAITTIDVEKLCELLDVIILNGAEITERVNRIS